ncbi:UNVERIFIED_CONTAM: Guanine nucleotide-binding protein subunit beta-1 [Sesamum radiatum]|uniref:Guanine nucleotide-binding protein subunit beta-1 n=1 Tax=Sesamum radiatum TaxID=300843 RepID=A0AAW2U5Q3_SESRA
MSVLGELKERHMAATQTLNALKHKLKQKRLLLLDTDVAGYARSQGKTPVTFGPTDLVCCRTLQGHTGKVYSLDWTPEKNRIVSASQDGRLIVWNALTSQKTHAIKLPCAWVMTCAFSPGGQSVACGGLDSVCSIFNLNSPNDKDGNLPVSRMLTGHKGYVSSCQYVPDEETHLITASGDQTCVLWDITTGLRTSVFGGEFQSGHTGDVLSVSINGSSSRMFVSGSCDSTVRLWDTRVASRAVRTFHGHEGDVNTVRFFPDGNRFGTGSDDGTCRLFDVRTGHQLQEYSRPDGENEVPQVTSIAFSISGRLLFAGYTNGDCYVWDTLLAKVYGILFRVVLQFLSCPSTVMNVFMYDAWLTFQLKFLNQQVVLNLGSLQNSHDGRISCVGLSGDGSALCTGSWDTSLKVSSHL